MTSTIAKQEIGCQEVHFTLEFLFNRGKTEPSSIDKLPKSQVHKFGTEELIGWMEVSEEDATQVIEDLLNLIEDGRLRAKYIFPSGESFQISTTPN